MSSICKTGGQVRVGKLTLCQYEKCGSEIFLRDWHWKHDGDRIALHAVNSDIQEMVKSLTSHDKKRLEQRLVKAFSNNNKFAEAAHLNRKNVMRKEIIIAR